MTSSYQYKTFTVAVPDGGKNSDLSKIQALLNKRIETQAKKGWKLLAITPIQSGKKDSQHNHHFETNGYGSGGWGWGAGWGYSYTSGLLITMEKQT